MVIHSCMGLTSERPSILFDLATARCVEQKILLPGVTVMARMIAQIRDRATTRLWNELSKLPDKNQCKMLENLLRTDPKSRVSGIDFLRNPPTRASAAGLIKAIDRLEKFRLFNSSRWNISKLPMGRIHVLSRYASMARAQTIERMNNARRIATLVSFVLTYTINAQDDVLDIIQLIFSELFKRSERKEKKTRILTIKDLDSAARKLKEVSEVLLDENISDKNIRRVIFSKIPKDALKSVLQTIDSLTKPSDQTVAFDELFNNYSIVRRFLPKLMTTLKFNSTPAGYSTLQEWNFLVKSECKKGKNKYSGAPLNYISPSWKRYVVINSEINSCAYTFWVIERMLEALKNHDIFVDTSERFGDPRAKLLQGEAWDKVKSYVLRTLDWPASGEKALKPVAEKLDTSYRTAAERWEQNQSVRIETVNGRDRLILSPLDKLDESESYKLLNNRLQSLLPHIDLPELLLEVNRWVPFMDSFTHISEGGSRVKDLATSVCAVLVSEACNVGLEPVVQPGIPALEYDRLTWIDQNYFRTETLTQANAALVEFHTKLKLAQIWGGGEVASADGLRFVVPVKTINAGYNSKYFRTGKGVTYYNFTSDQFTGFHGIVIPGTIRDSIYLLQGVLEQQTVLQPKEIMTDTAGYTDLIFGLFGLLGFQFSPRIADIGESRFWRLDPNADYGVLNKLAKHNINKDIIYRHWEDMIRVAGSLKLGKVNPTQLIQTLMHGKKLTKLGRAIAEFGRIFKTQHLLPYIDDEGHRRRVLTQLNRGESRHSLGRAVFYGKKGELHQPYREGQEDQLGALGLVVNAIVIWNTKYIEIALDALRNEGYPLNEDDIQRLSPLGYEHINILGRYSFKLPEDIMNGGFRPLLKVENRD